MWNLYRYAEALESYFVFISNYMLASSCLWLIHSLGRRLPGCPGGISGGLGTQLPPHWLPTSFKIIQISLFLLLLLLFI